MNCIIVDDEPLAREELQTMVRELSELEVSGVFSNALSALEFLKANTVDLIFLDIEMPRLNGLDFAAQISGQTLLIFTTAYAQYALKSYELDALDYLLKPIEPGRLEKAILKSLAYKKLLTESAKNTFEGSNEDFLMIKSERRYHKINFKNIRFIEGLKDYVVIYTQKEKLITAMNLKNIHQKVPASTFLRVSKSYVVNVSFIDSFDNHTIYIDDFEIPIGEVYKHDFFDKYGAGLLL